jgi:Zn-dependent M16 (insulinase) family peptidase
MRLRSGVSTVCVAVHAPRLRAEGAAVFAVGCAALSDGLLYRRLRVAGGAYEVAAWHDPLSGLAFLTSHRDPDPARTRTLISEAALEMVRFPPSEEDVRLAVLSAFSGLERPLGPRGRCRLGMARHLTGVSRADMERLRRSLAGVRRDDLIERFPELLGSALESSSTFIFSPGGAGEEELFGRGAEVSVLSAGRYK